MMTKTIFENKRPDPADHGLEPEFCQNCGKLRSIVYEKVWLRNACFDKKSGVEVHNVQHYEVEEKGCEVRALYRYTGDCYQKYWYGNGRFCSTLCCEAFARAAHNAGYRLPTIETLIAESKAKIAARTKK